jgi:hypothetical protein
MTIKWGDPIECNGVRPDWLRDDEPIVVEWRGGIRSVPNAWTARSIDAEERSHSWSAVGGVLLPADHPAYVALARGFTPWSGGESAPDDWDATQPVLFRDRLAHTGAAWHWGHCDTPHPRDIIGYRKRNIEPRLARIEVEGSAPVEGVFIKQLSREEVLELWRKESTDALASATTVAERVVLMMRGLGLVRRDETLAERFTRETGHEVTEAVEAALNWKGE